MASFFKSLKKYSLTILTLTISVLTLFVYVRQTNLLSKQTETLIQQSKVSLWPYLVINTNMAFNDDGTLSKYSIVVYNSGTGPAIIEKVVLSLNGKEFRSWDDFYSHVLPDTVRHVQATIHTLHQQVVSTSETYTFIGWDRDIAVANYLLEKGVLADLKVSICYKSVFDECWTVTAKNFSPLGQLQIERVQSDRCQLEATTYFVN